MKPRRYLYVSLLIVKFISSSQGYKPTEKNLYERKGFHNIEQKVLVPTHICKCKVYASIKKKHHKSNEPILRTKFVKWVNVAIFFYE